MELNELSDSQSHPTLCLNMIVKNESKIITRLFDSVLPIIDCYCICDTGSTDNTVELIKEYFQERGVPGKVVIEPFKNFCHNRSFSLHACKGMSDYVLLLDADMILDIRSFDKNILRSADAFQVLQGNESFYYQNLRIVRNTGLFKYVGVTHEYVDCPPNTKTNILSKDVLFIKDIGDGGCKSDKFERDIRLLLQGIKDEPTNGRYYFYLANSYMNSGKYDEAITYYKKRIEIGGWFEEVWYSYYSMGMCNKHKGDYAQALWCWLEGYDFYSERLEGLYEILHYYRCNSKHKLGLVIYNMCKKILEKNLNRDQHLFLHNDVYTHLIYYEYSIIAAYNGINNINDEIILIFNNSHGGELSNLLSNMKFYKDILNQSKRLTFDTSINYNVFDKNMKFNSSSSCLIKNDNGNGYTMNVRYVNYYLNKNCEYNTFGNECITINKHLELDNNLNVLSESWMNMDYVVRRLVGIEDVKIFRDEKTRKLIYTGTGSHENGKVGVFWGDYDTENKQLVVKELQQLFKHTDCEKNWVYYSDKNGNTKIVYNWYPLSLCNINEEKNTIMIFANKTTPKLFSKIRGSTCGFKYIKKTPQQNGGNMNIVIEESEIWFVGHIVSYENPRHYYHVVIVFDEDMNLLRYSAPFKFEDEATEYCLSILVEDDRVLINYSNWDRTTRIGIYDKKYIDSIVKYTA